MGNLDLYEKVRVVPQEAQKPITGGRLKNMTDINPMWRIKTLTEQFGVCGVGWYYKVTNRWMVDHGDETAAFVELDLYIKTDGEWSQPISGIGGSMFASKERSGVYVDDECFKKATTDAISVACKQLGIGADIYWQKDSTKYQTNADGKENKERIDGKERERLKPVFKELSRMGFPAESACKTYKLDSIYQMSDLQIKDFLTRAKKVPDKSVGDA